MRLSSIAFTAAFIAIAGCATDAPSEESNELTEAFQHCALEQSNGWRLTAPPADFETILAIPAGKSSLGSELAIPYERSRVHEHWFVKDESHVAVCRHLDVPDSCDSHATFASLTKGEDIWMVDGSVMETICLYHERRK